MQVARAQRKLREWRTAEEHVGTYPAVGDNRPKGLLIPHRPVARQAKAQAATGRARGPSGRRRGNGPPSR